MTTKQIEQRMYQMLCLAVKRGSSAGLASTPIGEKIYVLRDVSKPKQETLGAVCGDYSLVGGVWKLRGKVIEFPVV